MGSAYSVRNLICAQVNTDILESAERLLLVNTFNAWAIQDLRHLSQGLGDRRAVKWSTLFSLLEETQHHHDQRIYLHRRTHFHPACLHYAMLPHHSPPQPQEPSSCSPVFFGYSYKPFSEHSEEKKESTALSDLNMRDHEQEELAAQLASLRQKHLKRVKSRELSREKACAALGREREQWVSQKNREVAAAKKSMSEQELGHFEKEVAEEIERKRAEWKEADAKGAAAFAAAAEEENGKAAAGLRAVESRMHQLVREKDFPKGQRLVKQHNKALEEVTKKVAKLRTELRSKQAELEQAKAQAGDKAEQQPHRGMILVAEGEVKKAAKEVEEAEGKAAHQQQLCQQAEDLSRREARYLPLFRALVKDDPSVGSDFGTMEVVSLVLLVLVCCQSQLHHKSAFAFDIATADDSSGGLTRSQLTTLVVKFVRAVERLGGCLANKTCDEEFLESMVERVFLETRQREILTKFEFQAWISHTVKKSKDLSLLFRVPWKFSNMSDLQLQSLSIGKQYELGFKSIEGLNEQVDHIWCTYREELSLPRKLVLHERALAMGANDPLKPDYSRFFAKTKQKLQSNAVPLNHGAYGNIVYHTAAMLNQMAIRLQSFWRAKVGRERATFLVQKNAFHALWKESLEEARAKVEETFATREAATGVARMKWDASVRMRQAKLLSLGKKLSREEVVLLMTEEETAVAQDEVNKDFESMAIKRGFKEKDGRVQEEKAVDAIHSETPNALKLLYSEKLKQARRAEQSLRRQTRVDFIVKSQLQKAGFDIDNPETFKIDLEEATKHNPNQPSSLKQASTLHDESLLKGASLLNLEERECLQYLGADLSMIYKVGTSKEEDSLLRDLSDPDPAFDDYMLRLKYIHDTITPQKATELALELPSKRLLMRYVQRFRNYPVESLQKHLVEHFRILPRAVGAVAQSLRAICSQDAESRCFALVGHKLLQTLRMKDNKDLPLLDTLNPEEHRKRQTGFNRRTLSRRQEALGFDQVPVDETRKRREKVRRMWAKVEALRAEMEAAQSELERAKRQEAAAYRKVVDYQKEAGPNEFFARFRQDMRISDGSPSLYSDKRMVADWYAELGMPRMERIEAAKHMDWIGRLIALGPISSSCSETTLVGLRGLLDDFIATATHYGRVIILERHLGVTQKSIKPERSRETDVGDAPRMYWKVCNIRFKFATDDDGLCNGSDELCAKSYGHSLRNSKAYTTYELSNLFFPLEAAIDFAGFRLHASCDMGIERLNFDSSGNVKGRESELVFGSPDRGQSIKNEDSLLDRKLKEAAATLNLAVHDVKGVKDMLPKAIPCAADVCAYRRQEGIGFALTGFRRCFPPEHPAATPHLPSGARGHSIFWRQLRPEFVKAYPVRLSPDALSLFAKDCPGMEKHNAEVYRATKALIEDSIPAFAKELSLKPAGEVKTLNLRLEFHKRGINMRHIGLLRSFFWFRLAGYVSVTFKKPSIRCTEAVTNEIQPGHFLCIKGELFKVSVQDFQEGATHCELEDPPDFSAQDEVVRAGKVEMSGNSEAVRDALLVEILARTLKNMLRFLWRKLCGLFAGPAELALSTCAAEFLNLIIGASEGTDDFWEKHVPDNAVRRYGNLCLSVQEKRNLFNHIVQHSIMLNILERLTEMGGVELASPCWTRLRACFTRDSATPRHVLPVTTAEVTLQCRVKNNFFLFDASRGLSLAAKADRLLSTSYQDVVLSTEPVGYWPLTQKKGAVLAVNMGSTGLKYSGRVVSCISGIGGRVKNQWPDYATCFPKHLEEYKAHEAEVLQANDQDNKVDGVVISGQEVVEVNKAQPASCAKIDVVFNDQLVPQGQHEAFSIDCWARCEGCRGRARTIAMSGRYSLCISREDLLEFTIMDSVLAVGVTLTAREVTVEEGRWMYLTGTFDGLMARFYVDAVLQAEEDVPAAAHRLFTRRRIRVVEGELRRQQEEKAERENAERFVKEEADRFFSTKAGKVELSSMIKHAIAKTNAKLKLQKEKAKILGIKALSQAEAKSQVLREYVAKKLAEYEEKITARHHRLKLANIEEEERLLMRAKENAASHLRLGASVSKVRKSEGREFFIGSLQHLSIANYALGRETITKRFVTAAYTSHDAASLVLKEALDALETSMVDCHSDPLVLTAYAKVLSNLYLSNEGGGSVGVSRVEAAVEAFKGRRNPQLIAEILEVLPDGEKYAPLAQQCWTSIQAVDASHYVSGNPVERKKRLLALESVPDRFSLTRRNAEDCSQKFIVCAADIYKFVFKHMPEIYGTEAGDMSWLCALPSSGLVCYLVDKIKAAIRYCKRLSEHQRMLFNRGLLAEQEEIDSLSYMQSELQEILLPSEAKVGAEDLLHLAKNLPLVSAVDFSSSNACSAEPQDMCKFFQQVKFLQVVTLAKCGSVDDATLASLGKNCVGVRRIDISHCSKVTDVGISALLDGCPKIFQLHLGYCERISDLTLAIVAAKLPKLSLLCLAWCTQLTDQAFAAFAQQCVAKDTLTDLNVAGCSKLCDNGLLSVASNLGSIRSLQLDFCYRVTAEGVRKMTHRLWELEKLSLVDVYQVADASFAFDAVGDGRGLAKERMLTKLTAVDLSDCNHLTDHAVELLASRATALADLSLAGCPLLTDDAVRSLLTCRISGDSRGKCLTRLDLSYCTNISASAVDMLSRGCPRLQELSLRGFAKLGADEVRQLCERCQGIQSLSLAHCKLVDDETIRCVTRELWLEHLDVSYCTKLTDDALDAIAQGCGGLLTLNLSWCRKATQQGVTGIVSSCSWLNRLWVTGCDNLSEECINDLLLRYPKLTIQS